MLNNTGKIYYPPQGVNLIGDPTITYIHKRRLKKTYTKELIPYLEILAPKKISDKLLKINPAPGDRVLKKRKEKCLTQRYCPHPHASVVKKKIPIQSYFDKPKYGWIGYTETDLVHLCDSNTQVDFCYGLTDTEINTDWTEVRALRNRARVWTEGVLKKVDQSVPLWFIRRS